VVLCSVKLETLNTVKDGGASVLTVVALMFSSAGIIVFDAVVGCIIASGIIRIDFIALKESSSMLMDACDGQFLLQSEVIKRITKSVDGISTHILSASGDLVCSYLANSKSLSPVACQ